MQWVAGSSAAGMAAMAELAGLALAFGLAEAAVEADVPPVARRKYAPVPGPIAMRRPAR